MTYKSWIWTLLLFEPFLLMSVHWDDISTPHARNTSQPLRETGSNPLTAKGCDNTTADPIPVELAMYYKYTNLAARAIFDNNFGAASVHYDSAFIYKQYPFYEDLKKYILVNFKSGLFDKNGQALYHLIHHKKIDTAQLFAALPKRVFDDKNLKLINQLVKQRSKGKASESALAMTLKDIYGIDQSVRDYNLFMEKSIESRNAIYASRDSVDAANFIKFEKLYAQYGFPDEESVGVFFDSERQWANVISILLLHFTKTKDAETAEKVMAIIKAALNSGKLHTSICASLLEENEMGAKDLKNEYYFLSTTIHLVMGDVYRPFVFYTDSLMNTVNTNRIAIGLDSFHIMQKQVVCQFIGAKSNAPMNIIPMAPYASINDLPPGLVKMSCDEANIDYHSYKINTAKIMDKCHCEEKVY